MIKIEILGNVGRDAETKTLGAKAYASFSVCAKDGSGKNAPEIWFSVLGNEKLTQYITKGKKLFVRGSLSVKAAEGKVYYNVMAQEIEFAGGGGESKGEDAKPAVKAAPKGANPFAEEANPLEPKDGDLPF